MPSRNFNLTVTGAEEFIREDLVFGVPFIQTVINGTGTIDLEYGSLQSVDIRVESNVLFQGGIEDVDKAITNSTAVLKLASSSDTYLVLSVKAVGYNGNFFTIEGSGSWKNSRVEGSFKITPPAQQGDFDMIGEGVWYY